MIRFAAPSFRRALAPAFGIAALLALAACRAPGMKMDPRALDAKVQTVEMDGQKVTLRPLTPQAVQEFGHRPREVEDLAGLLETKADPYHIGPQDILLVTVWDHPELTLPLGQFRTDAATGMVVDEQGFLYYPYVGRVKVGGLTVVQARELLTTKLDSVLQKPQVDVKVLAFRSQKIFINGEVRNPGTYTLTDVPMTLAEAIARVGGFLPTADQSRLTLTRGSKTWNLDLLDLLGKGSLVDHILLKDGDALMVHNRAEAPVYVLGEVRLAGPVPAYNGRLTLAQALSEAGGVNNTSADARSIYVLRRGATPDAADVFHLDGYNPVAMVLADRFQLQPRDIVYVDAGRLVRWNRVVSLILPSSSILTSIPAAASNSRNAFGN